MRKLLAITSLVLSTLVSASTGGNISEMNDYNGFYSMKLNRSLKIGTFSSENTKYINYKKSQCQIINLGDEPINLPAGTELRVYSKGDNSLEVNDEVSFYFYCDDVVEVKTGDYFCSWTNSTGTSETFVDGFLPCLLNFEKPVAETRRRYIGIESLTRVNKILNSAGYEINYKH